MNGDFSAENTGNTAFMRMYVWLWPTQMCGAGQNRKCTAYMTVHLVISLPILRYTAYMWSTLILSH